MIARKRMLFAVVAILALYTAVWFVLAGVAERRIIAQLEAQAAHGMQITTGIHSKSGFPFALQIRLRDFTLRTQSGLTLEAPMLVMGARLTNWSHATVNAPDGTLVTIPAGHARAQIKAAISSVDGGVDFDPLGIHDAGLTLHALSATGLVEGTGALTAGEIDLHVDRPGTTPTDHTQVGGHTIVNATAIQVPGAKIQGLGNQIKRLTFDAVLMGKVPTLDEASLKAWSEDGGTIEVHELSTDWGPLGLGLGGTVTLDGDLQPIGSFSAKISGFGETIDALSASNAIKPTNAGLMNIALGLLAKPEGDNNTPTISVPMSIQNREVYVSSFKLAGMPLIRLY